MQHLSAPLSVSPAASTPADANDHRRRRRRTPLASVLIALVFALLATACGGAATEVNEVETSSEATSEQAADRPTVAQVEPTAVPPEPTPTPEEGSIEDVAAATVKIVAEGTFVAPLELQRTATAGIGTGFIIDDSGLLVTNNHVVTGAAFVEVYLDGEAEPTNARLLGVSECSDLAVLDLDGEGYEFLEFRADADEVRPGLSIYAAGYPLNLDTDFSDVDYTLTAGIVSTTEASGESSWASVDDVIEHDARIRGGNSGGPLVDEQGRVVGINYAGEDSNDLNFAIAASEAAATIEALKSGDVESLGINGQAIVTENGNGVWVSAVASGSPADQAGVQAGDLITTMEGLPLASDGTLSDYCDIIRTNGPNDTLSIEVVRLGSEEVLTGQINGSPLTQSFSFAAELSDTTADAPSTTSGGYTQYEFIADDTGSVGVEVPVEWTDRDGAVNPNFGESIYAAPDIASFNQTWDVPGVIVERSGDLTSADIDDVLDLWSNLDCADRSGREPFATDDGVFAGKWEVFTNCGGTETATLILAVSPQDGNSVVRMFFQIVSDADLDAADRALATFDSVL